MTCVSLDLLWIPLLPKLRGRTDRPNRRGGGRAVGAASVFFTRSAPSHYPNEPPAINPHPRRWSRFLAGSRQGGGPAELALLWIGSGGGSDRRRQGQFGLFCPPHLASRPPAGDRGLCLGGASGRLGRGATGATPGFPRPLAGCSPPPVLVSRRCQRRPNAPAPGGPRARLDQGAVGHGVRLRVVASPVQTTPDRCAGRACPEEPCDEYPAHPVADGQ